MWLINRIFFLSFGHQVDTVGLFGHSQKQPAYWLEAVLPERTWQDGFSLLIPRDFNFHEYKP
jgi:hypothetical protein